MGEVARGGCVVNEGLCRVCVLVTGRRGAHAGVVGRTPDKNRYYLQLLATKKRSNVVMDG